MTTALDLINGAMDDAGLTGVGQTPLAEDVNKALTRLNAMVAQWSRRRWMVYHLVDIVFTGTGALSYSIGPGGDISVNRPDRIESGFFRQNAGVPGNAVDFDLTILQSREDYNRIALKGLGSFPLYAFYDSGFPLGNIFIWPLPDANYEMHLSVKPALQSFPALNTVFNLPPEYEEAIRLNLAVRLRVTYSLPADAGLIGLAKVALNTIKNTNAQIPSLLMPDGLRTGGGYNVYADHGGGT
jgi:hypothetical protein